jgi:ribosome-binding factor A
MNHRPLRVANLIRDELSAILVREMEFGGALATITEVVIDDKMDMARVRVSVLPANKDEEVFRSLRKAQGFLQHVLSKKLNIRPMPFIRFEIDHGLEKAAVVEKILIQEEKKAEAPTRRAAPKKRAPKLKK